MAERLGDYASDLPCFDGAIGRDVRRNAADGEDAALVHVLDRIVEFQVSVLAADDEDRDLPLEGDEALEKRRLALKLMPRRDRFSIRADQDLALAVIAEAPRLEDARQAHNHERIAQAFLVMHIGVAGH